MFSQLLLVPIVASRIFAINVTSLADHSSRHEDPELRLSNSTTIKVLVGGNIV